MSNTENTATGTPCNQANARRIGTVRLRYGRIVPTTGGWRVGFNSKAGRPCLLGFGGYHETLEAARAGYRRLIEEENARRRAARETS